jgi:hypothetical protein
MPETISAVLSKLALNSTAYANILRSNRNCVETYQKGRRGRHLSHKISKRSGNTQDKKKKAVPE